MLVPIKQGFGRKGRWLLEDRPATRRAASTPGPSGQSRGSHGPRTYEQRPAEQTKPLPFKPTISRVMAKLAGFLGLNRRKAA
jgi:hypothetical protein